MSILLENAQLFSSSHLNFLSLHLQRLRITPKLLLPTFRIDKAK